MPESEPSFESTLPFEDDAAELDVRAMHVLEGDPVPPADLACPKCGGTLWEFTENQHMRYRCRVGHAFTADSLLVHQANDVEDAFWMALRTLEESASLARRMLKRARDNGHRHVAARLERQVHEAEHRAQIVRDVLLSGAVELATNAAVTNDTTGR